MTHCPDLITLPIVPPLALTLGLSNVGVSGDLTFGYDTYGVSQAWIPQDDPTAGYVNPATEGFFLTDPSYFHLMGGVVLGVSADLGLVQVGGGGTLNIQFGIQGLHEGTAFPIDPTKQTLPPNSGMLEPHHAPLLGGKQEKTLQLGDLEYDLGQGGPLCPFNIGGNISIGLEAYITVGVGPFSVTVDVDFGNITLASFTIDTCGGNQETPQLAEAFDSAGNPLPTNPNSRTLTSDLAGLSTVNSSWPGSLSAVAALLRKADSSYDVSKQQFILLDLGQLDNHLQADNYNSGQSSETFEVSPVPKSNDLLVSAYAIGIGNSLRGHGSGAAISGSDHNNQNFANQDPLGLITAYNVEKVDVDANDSNYTGGGEQYVVNEPPKPNIIENESFYDLSQTGIAEVNLNFYQWEVQDEKTVNDKNADQVNFYETDANDQVELYPTLGSYKTDQNGNPVTDPQTGEPIYQDAYSNVSLGSPARFTVSMALTKAEDLLNVYTTPGHENIYVVGTQPNQTYINGGVGDNKIQVGSIYLSGGYNPGQGGNLFGILGLDAIEGPLVIDAGGGHN